MTEKEVFETQEQNGNTQFYLIRNGIFFHANGHGAYALSRVTGYKAMSKHRKEGDIVQTGFGVKQIAKVIKKIEAARGTVQKIDEDTYLFNGIDGTPDESIIATSHRTPSPCKGELPGAMRELFPPSSSPCKREVSEGRRGNDFQWLADALRNFNLSAATPLEAMLFIGQLQRKLTEYR